MKGFKRGEEQTGWVEKCGVCSLSSNDVDDSIALVMKTVILEAVHNDDCKKNV